ncbi:cell envelope integrity protein TolA [Lysobacter ciconiae]|uniref:Cell envelope integrity protein TolA n=1 Tax=Novilysobacter ciconiae TaxID=2781022 RepID=A0A7S6ZS40_9GAMM|nr:cell envelope integrity protein TolA [Lysobacter ciconiae]QOW19139.1 cell envelope integrity protein TolA [Lysobacter ciconiae]
MRETRADTQQAIVLAIILHVVLFALMFAGMLWTRSAAPQSAAGAPVEADLVDANALSAAMQRVLDDRPEPVPPLPEPVDEPIEEPVVPPPAPTPQPQPLPSPVPEDSPTPPQSQPQDFIPKPDTAEQAEVVATPTPTPSDEKKLQEEKRRQAQVDLTERERQQEAERKRRLAERAKEAKETEEREKKLAEIQRKRAEAEREIKLAEQRLKQVADAQARASNRSSESSGASDASPPPGNHGRDTGLEAQYAAALRQAIVSKWTRPETVPLGSKCTIIIKQLRGGEVTSASVSSPCAYDEQGRRSIEAAVLKAQPLPYSGFESVFARTLTLNFEAADR